jgi:hypothetical protein
MFRTGIWRLVPLERLQDPRLADTVSYQLLKDPALEDPAKHQDAEKTFEAIVKHLRLSSGIYRSTWPNRFADLDPVVKEILCDVYGTAETGASLEVHDWAASDCRVSAEWAASLWKKFPAARVIASDLYLCLNEVSRGREAFIFEPDGTPLQYVRPPFVVPLQKPIPAHYPFNRWLASRARKSLHVARESVLGPAKKSSWTVQPISLIHPAARRLLAIDPRFEIRRHSIFTPLPQPCHAIRTMNIFNLGYFSEDGLRAGAACVTGSLVDGGIWILGRTTQDIRPSVNSVSIFQKNGSSLKLVRQLNGGSEIEELALSAGPA